MKRIILCTVLCLVCMMTTVLAAPVPRTDMVIGDRSLVDTQSFTGLQINLDEFFASHPLAPGAASRGDVVFTSPRCQVVLVTNHGPLIGLHHHASAEETVYVYKGAGEMYIDGKWIPVKAGDVHVNPRGVIHGTRVVGDQDMEAISIFTPPQANGNDKVMYDASAEGTVVGDAALLDTSYTKGMLINADEFFASHPLANGAAARSDVIFQSPRISVNLGTNHGPLIGRHYHQSAEEINIIYQGSGEIFIDGKWTPVKAGDLHINPRGIIHGTRVVGDQNLKVIGFFTPPQANGNDKVMIDK